MFRFRLAGSILTLGCLTWFLGPAQAAESTDTLTLCLDSLAHSDSAKTTALQCLIASGNDSLKSLYQNLFMGNVYIANLPGSPGALVIPDSETEGADTLTVHRAWPYTAVLGTDGKALRFPSDSLTTLDVDREMRGMLQPVLTAMDLKNPDRSKRLDAATNIGESADTTQLPALVAALRRESDSKVIRALKVSIATLKLFSTDPQLRAEAAEQLGYLRASNALPEMKSLLDTTSGEKDPTVRKALSAAVNAIQSWNDAMKVVQNVFTGLSLGSILILMALGLSVIFGLMGVINMAHGEFMMIGAYATYLVQNIFRAKFPGVFDWFLLVSFPCAFLVAGGVGMLVEATIIKRLYGRPLETLLATWGLSLLFIQTARSLFGDLTAVSTPALLSGGWEIFPQVVLPYNRLFIIALTIAVVAGMSALFYATPIGTTIRAVTQNRSMSACLGVRTRRVDCLTFGLGAGIAGIAGCALTQIGNVDPGMGQNYIVDSFMVVVAGGVGKLAGTVIAGLGIGSLNKILEPFFQTVYAKVILLGLVILFLQRRPSGLFPAKGRNEDT